jgi:hypothetical protein
MSEYIEQIYEDIALAIDEVEPAQVELFLCKLALSLGHEIGDVAAVRKSIEIARCDLE